MSQIIREFMGFAIYENIVFFFVSSPWCIRERVRAIFCDESQRMAVEKMDGFYPLFIAVGLRNIALMHTTRRCMQQIM
jgi:hypothetical protein